MSTEPTWASTLMDSFKVIYQTWFIPEWKQAHECARYSPGARRALLTVYGHNPVTQPFPSHLSWILILHETLSCLWLQMKGSVGVTVEECKSCLKTFLCTGHMIHLRFLLNVLTGISRPCQVEMSCLSFSLCMKMCTFTLLLSLFQLWFLLLPSLTSKMCFTGGYRHVHM